MSTQLNDELPNKLNERLKQLKEDHDKIETLIGNTFFGKNEAKEFAESVIKRDSKQLLDGYHFNDAEQYPTEDLSWGNQDIIFNNLLIYNYKCAVKVLVASNLIQDPQARYQVAREAANIIEKIKKNEIGEKQIKRDRKWTVVGIGLIIAGVITTGIMVAGLPWSIIPAVLFALGMTGGYIGGTCIAGINGLLWHDHAVRLKNKRDEEISAIDAKFNKHQELEKANSFLREYETQSKPRTQIASSQTLNKESEIQFQSISKPTSDEKRLSDKRLSYSSQPKLIHPLRDTQSESNPEVESTKSQTEQKPKKGPKNPDIS